MLHCMHLLAKYFAKVPLARYKWAETMTSKTIIAGASPCFANSSTQPRDLRMDEDPRESIVLFRFTLHFFLMLNLMSAPMNRVIGPKVARTRLYPFLYRVHSPRNLLKRILSTSDKMTSISHSLSDVTSYAHRRDFSDELVELGQVVPKFRRDLIHSGPSWMFAQAVVCIDYLGVG